MNNCKLYLNYLTGIYVCLNFRKNIILKNIILKYNVNANQIMHALIYYILNVYIYIYITRFKAINVFF